MRFIVKLETNEIRHKEYAIEAEDENKAAEKAKKIDLENSKNNTRDGLIRDLMLRSIQSPKNVEKTYIENVKFK